MAQSSDPDIPNTVKRPQSAAEVLEEIMGAPDERIPRLVYRAHSLTTPKGDFSRVMGSSEVKGEDGRTTRHSQQRGESDRVPSAYKEICLKPSELGCYKDLSPRNLLGPVRYLCEERLL